MKTTLNSLMMAAMFIGLGSTAFAQKTATAEASAVVLADLTINLDGAQNAINFGNISASTPGAVVLDANGTGNENTGTLTNVARFDLKGANSEVTVSYDPSVTLKGPAVEATMLMTPEVVGAAVDTEQAAATPVTSESTVQLSENAYYLWVGGTIPALSNQASGTYEGTFNIAVEYN